MSLRMPVSMETIAANGSCIQRQWCHTTVSLITVQTGGATVAIHIRQHSLNKANAPSLMNSKGDPAVTSKPGEMKCKLTLQRAF